MKYSVTFLHIPKKTITHQTKQHCFKNILKNSIFYDFLELNFSGYLIYRTNKKDNKKHDDNHVRNQKHEASKTSRINIFNILKA